MNQTYIDTVRLLIAVAPIVFESPRFAMKGGTALNLFVHDMPRLSVDIDLAFVDHLPDRNAALELISSDLTTARATIERLGYRVSVPRTAKDGDVKLLIQSDAAQVKIEVNYVFRGTLLPAEHRSLVQSAQEVFTANIRVPLLQISELYGSKLVAAMDRQHPRDIFDVQSMYSRFGLQAEIVSCFVAYLVGHNRPIHEVLFAPAKNIEALYHKHFVGMTRDPVELDVLLETQTELLHDLPRALTHNHREFLSSFVRLEPAWERMPFPNLRDLPGVRWKMANLDKLRTRDRARFEMQLKALDERFKTIEGESSDRA